MHQIPLNSECTPTQTLENAYALQFQLAPPEPWRSLIVWRDGPKPFKPVEKRRLRDLRPGDTVIYQGRRETICAVEIYR